MQHGLGQSGMSQLGAAVLQGLEHRLEAVLHEFHQLAHHVFVLQRGDRQADIAMDVGGDLR